MYTLHSTCAYSTRVANIGLTRIRGFIHGSSGFSAVKNNYAQFGYKCPMLRIQFMMLVDSIAHHNNTRNMTIYVAKSDRQNMADYILFAINIPYLALSILGQVSVKGRCHINNISLHIRSLFQEPLDQA